MKKPASHARPVSPGISRSRRPKKGLSKQITFWVSEEEKEAIERAAAAAGVSMSRFIMEKALKTAKNVLRAPRSKRGQNTKTVSSTPSPRSTQRS